jgi:hypothetical protein
MTVVCCWQCPVLGWADTQAHLQDWLELHYQRVHDEV